MKLYKRGETVEFESQSEDESDQLNFLFLLLSKEPVKWGISLRDGKHVLSLRVAGDKND